jgi:hypothetical protein
MKKIIMIAAAAAFAAGCQTRITAEKNPEVAHPIQAKVTVNGEDMIINTGYMVTSGGWYATARSPLYATETLRGLDIGVATNGTVHLGLDAYDRDLSTNAIVMVKTIFDGSVNLVNACAKAYATIQSAGATTAAGAVADKIAAYFREKGGDPAKSTVIADETAKTVTVTDGSTSICCDALGNCSECGDGGCAVK